MPSTGQVRGRAQRAEVETLSSDLKYSPLPFTPHGLDGNAQVSGGEALYGNLVKERPAESCDHISMAEAIS